MPHRQRDGIECVGGDGKFVSQERKNVASMADATTKTGQIRVYNADTVVFYSGWFGARCAADASGRDAGKKRGSAKQRQRCGFAPTRAPSSGKFAGSFSRGEET